MSASVLQIFVLREGKLLASELFPEGVYLVGSDPSCDLVLDDPAVALQHAQLQFGGGQVLLVDDASAGVLINGEPVQIAVVRSADDLQVGPFLIKTRVLAKRRPAQTPPPAQTPGGPRLSAVPSLSSAAEALAAPRTTSIPSAPRAAPRMIDAPEARKLQEPRHGITVPPQPAHDVDLDAFDVLFDKVMSVQAPAAAPESDELPDGGHQELRQELQGELDDDVEVELEAEVVDEVRLEPEVPLESWVAEGSAIQTAITAPVEVADAPAATAELPEPHPVAFEAAELSLPLELARAVPPAPPPPPPRSFTPPQPLPARTITPPALPAARAAAPQKPAADKSRKPSRAVAPGAGLQPTTVLHARVLWGEDLVAARSFAATDWVDLGGDEEAALPAYGFPGVPQLAVYENASWRIAPPLGVNVLERFADGPWRPVAAEAKGQVRLSGGRSLRLSGQGVHVELFAEWPQPALKGALTQLIDWRGLALVVTIAAALVTFITLLPPVPKVIPLPPPPRPRLVRAEMKQEKPKKQKQEKQVAQSAQKVDAPRPSAAQSARNYKQAAAPLRALEKVTRATADVSRLLAGLKLASYRPRGGSPDALPVMPTSSSPRPLPGIGGGVGMGGTPVTHGQDLLRGGPGGGRGGGAGDLGSGSAGKGPVRGVPVTLPSRPAKIQGQIDRDAVAQVINDHVNEIRGCYERALLENPNIGAGKVALEWTIGGDGSVVEVGTKVSTLKSPEVVGCLLDLLRGLKFPKPQGGVVVVSYPILFNAVGY